MKEAEVSLRVAHYYIRNRLTTENVKVSLDGAHIKTRNQIHFDIYVFLSKENCSKMTGQKDNWQGIYNVEGY